MAASAIVTVGLLPLSAEAARCKDYRRCAEAVKAWCTGQHPRADRDRDGIPCENVCKSRAQVKAALIDVGCKQKEEERN